jgi:hypothetical protein
MNAKLFAAAAAALSLAAGVAQASPDRAVQAFLDDAHSQAQAQLGDLDLAAHPVKAWAYVDGQGRLTAVRVVQSAGSRDADYKVETAIKRVRLHDVPPALIGAQVNLTFGPADTQLAKVP